MIGVKHLKDFISTKYEPTDQNYLLVQSNFEGYLKRLLFIALRKNGLQYKYSQELMSYASNQLLLSEQTNLIFSELCGTSYSFIKKKDKKLEELERCIFNYVRPVRNTLAHGADHKLNPDLLNLCIKITQEYVKTIEYHLCLISGNSAFDEPKKWGAKRINKKSVLSTHLKKTFKFRDVKKFDAVKIKTELSKEGINLL